MDYLQETSLSRLSLILKLAHVECLVFCIDGTHIPLRSWSATDSGQWPMDLSTPSQSTQPLRLPLSHNFLQQSSRTSTNCLPRVRIQKIHQKKRHIILPRYPPKTPQIRHGNKVPVTVRGIANFQLLEIHPVVHVPSKQDRAESEARLGNGEEFLFRY